MIDLMFSLTNSSLPPFRIVCYTTPRLEIAREMDCDDVSVYLICEADEFC